jgi:hypothetical protein
VGSRNKFNGPILGCHINEKNENIETVGVKLMFKDGRAILMPDPSRWQRVTLLVLRKRMDNSPIEDLKSTSFSHWR